MSSFTAVLQFTLAVLCASGVLSGSELVHVPDTLNMFYTCLSHLFSCQRTMCIQVTVYVYFVLSFINYYLAVEGTAFSECYCFSFVYLKYYFVIFIVTAVTSFPALIL